MKTAQYTKGLTIALPPDIYRQIKQITDAEHISMAEWVRKALEAALKQQQPKEDNM